MGGILQLIEPYERDGTLVRRDERHEIERDALNFYGVIEHDGVIFACAALYPTRGPRTARWPRHSVTVPAGAILRAAARSASSSARGAGAEKASSC